MCGCSTKINPAGSSLVYSTYLSGNSNASGEAITIDNSGSAYITGVALSGLPTTIGAYQTTSGGNGDAFVIKLNMMGSDLVYGTYLGGNAGCHGRGIAVDNDGNAYIVGYVYSPDFPTTVGAYQTTLGGGFDAFVVKLNTVGSRLVYSTYLGGSNNEAGRGIAIDSNNNAYVTGDTNSTNFPITNGAYQTSFGSSDSFTSDGFMIKLNATGNILVYSTYLGGSSDDQGFGIAMDSSSTAYG